MCRRTRAVIEDSNNRIEISAVTLWEISLKHALGKLELTGVVPEDLPAVAAQMRMPIQPLVGEDAATYHRLPRTAHKDPFDRMIVWQCLRRRWTLISADGELEQYRNFGLDLLW
jgi:PIN domain nuclease of toxin-antitoxin system